MVWIFINSSQKPQPKQPWSSMSAIEYGPACMQFMDFHMHDKFSSKSMKNENEDCLYLNVFAPFVVRTYK